MILEGDREPCWLHRRMDVGKKAGALKFAVAAKSN